MQFKNWEVDLVALDRTTDELVFVEVKHRRRTVWGGGETAVDYRKVAKMQRVAAEYCRQHQFKKPYRFDIIASTGDLQKPEQVEIEHFENITWLS